MSGGARGLRGHVAAVSGWAFLVTVWLVTGAIASAIGFELMLKARSAWRAHEVALNDPAPRRHALERAYVPFLTQHLHPQYVFFFPRHPRERMALSNETCRLDADGFRGSGPAHAGGRRLAFLLGGSSAFGYMASSDATTITGYLNRIQDRYFFVNAGVPGWNSTQEMFRLAFQILDYRPALIVTYDGANDASLINSRDLMALDYSIGDPDGFRELSALVEGYGTPTRAVGSLAAYLLPEIDDLFAKRFGPAADRARERSTPLPADTWQAGVSRYLSNLSRMRDLASAQGARFIAVFQPVAQLHRHLGPGPAFDYFEEIDRFHEAIATQAPRGLEFHDLGEVFDRHYASIPIVNPDITGRTVFVDQVHLYDPGNEIVARELARLIQ